MKRNAQSALLGAAVLAAALFAAAATRASGPVPLEVTASDLTAAGIADASVVSPSSDRFGAPMRYFRSSEKLSAADAKRDCADCGDLIAVYAADVPSPPGWASEPRSQFLTVGGRYQLRDYIAVKRRIVTVTAPGEAMTRRLSAYLVAKFSK